MIDALLWGFAAALFIFTLAGGIGARWSLPSHDKVHHTRDHRDHQGNPLDIDVDHDDEGWER